MLIIDVIVINKSNCCCDYYWLPLSRYYKHALLQTCYLLFFHRHFF